MREVVKPFPKKEPLPHLQWHTSKAFSLLLFPAPDIRNSRRDRLQSHHPSSGSPSGREENHNTQSNESNRMHLNFLHSIDSRILRQKIEEAQQKLHLLNFQLYPPFGKGKHADSLGQTLIHYLLSRSLIFHLDLVGKQISPRRRHPDWLTDWLRRRTCWNWVWILAQGFSLLLAPSAHSSGINFVFWTLWAQTFVFRVVGQTIASGLPRDYLAFASVESFSMSSYSLLNRGRGDSSRTRQRAK